MRSILNKVYGIWTGYSEKKEQIAESVLLNRWSKVPQQNIKITDTQISDIKDDKIHCIALATGKKEPLVMIPGFGASGALYYKVMQGLSEKYDLYLVDMRGMGCSGRPAFLAKTQAEAEQYIIEGIEKWREKMGLEKVIMCGHSLGGYMATKYAKYYPSRVSSIVLISPAGLWQKPVDFDLKMQDIVRNLGFFRRYVFKKVSNSWQPGKSPMELFRNFGPLAGLLLNSYVGYYASLTKAEKKDVKKYLFQILMKPGTGEYAMTYFLHPGAYGIEPLEKTLNELQVPISIYFGTRDWVAASTPPNAHLMNPFIRQSQIKDATHQICTDKPKELIEKIVEDLKVRPEHIRVLLRERNTNNKYEQLMSLLNINLI